MLAASLRLPLILLSLGADPAARPNVVLIVGDDMGWTDFGFMGSQDVRTPHLDQLAAQSAFFPNAYVPTSLCRASLATLLTGQYPHEHGICCNDPPEGVDRALMLPFIGRAPTIPRLLGAAGYASLQTGKFWEGHYRNAGFTEGMTTRGRHGEEGLAIGRQTMAPIEDFVRRHHDRPFFLWYAPMLPHEPHNPPERFLVEYSIPGRPPKLARYYAMCAWFDDSCGQLLASLEREGLSDRTLVVFVVDNGWIQELSPTRTTRGWFAPKSKLSPYDGGLRTPLLLRWPGKLAPGRRAELVSTIDVAPTILAACDAPVPSQMRGANLIPIARGEKALERDAVQGAIFLHSAVDLENPTRNVTHRWIRRGDWKLIQPAAEDKAAELYNVASDPSEEHDLAKTKPDLVRELVQRLDQWWPGK